MSNELEQKLKTLPDKSGVYLMRNAAGEVIYVGKAKVLKNRVRSYFKSHNHPPKVAAMVSNIADFEYIITDSELEALVLENNLIKEYTPHYNILLKDDKTYPFLKLSVQDDYPRLTITRTVKKDGARYFGPYQSAVLLRDLLELIRDLFQLRSCNHSFPEDIGKSRPCLYYHIGKCMGVCRGDVAREHYAEVVKRVIAFINGDYTHAIGTLTEQMHTAAQALDFEKAAKLRDQLHSIEVLGEKQKIVSAGGDDMDAIAMASQNNKTCVQVFFIRSGKIVGREHYILENTDGAEPGEVLSDFIRQYYERSTFVPHTLLVQHDIADGEVVEQWLCKTGGRSVRIKTPKIGENVKLIRMIAANAAKELSEQELKILRDIQFKNKALVSLRRILHLSKTPSRMEAYDISNISGDNNVGAMVVFEDAKPCRKDYRNFRIKNVAGADDYACMKEVLTRRFSRALEEQERVDAGELAMEDAKFLPMPDVVFVDGGQGHVTVGREALDGLGIDLPVFGIVKDEAHRTRGIVSVNGELEMERSDEGFLLLVNMQDEMHRRAVGYHDKLHRKKGLSSELEHISGVGEKRRKALLKAFKSVKNIREATVEEIAGVPGVDRTTAENVYRYFHQADGKEEK